MLVETNLKWMRVSPGPPLFLLDFWPHPMFLPGYNVAIKSRWKIFFLNKRTLWSSESLDKETVSLFLPSVLLYRPKTERPSNTRGKERPSLVYFTHNFFRCACRQLEACWINSFSFYSQLLKVHTPCNVQSGISCAEGCTSESRDYAVTKTRMELNTTWKSRV